MLRSAGLVKHCLLGARQMGNEQWFFEIRDRLSAHANRRDQEQNSKPTVHQGLDWGRSSTRRKDEFSINTKKYRWYDK